MKMPELNTLSLPGLALPCPAYKSNNSLSVDRPDRSDATRRRGAGKFAIVDLDAASSPTTDRHGRVPVRQGPRLTLAIQNDRHPGRSLWRGVGYQARRLDFRKDRRLRARGPVASVARRWGRVWIRRDVFLSWVGILALSPAMSRG